MLDKEQIRRYTILFSALLIAALTWWHFIPTKQPVNEYHSAQIAPQIIKTPKVTIKPEKVVVYSQVAKKKLELTPEMQADASKHVIEATRIEADIHPQTVVSVIDDKTGVVETVVRREPLPWLAAEQTGYFRAGYGYLTGMLPVYRIAASENLIQIKAWHVGIDGSLDIDATVYTLRQGYGGFHVEYRW